MKRNIFALVAMLAMFGFVSCDMGRDDDVDVLEPQQQEDQFMEEDEFNTDEELQDDQQMQEDLMEEEQLQQGDMMEDDNMMQDDTRQNTQDTDY